MGSVRPIPSGSFFGDESEGEGAVVPDAGTDVTLSGFSEIFLRTISGFTCGVSGLLHPAMPENAPIKKKITAILDN
jgi:hypothetical protein